MNKKGKIFIVIGTILVLISLTMTIHNKYEEVEAGNDSKEALSLIKTEVEENNQDDSMMQTLLSNNEVKEMKTTKINGYDYIGTITIPALKLELPVMSEYDYNRLKKSPCRYYGSVYTNDLIICAHSYRTHFKYLDKLKQKDLIAFTDIDGNNYFYEVLEIEILKPTDVEEMINNEFDLTLYTCTSDGNNRITVRCNRVEL